MVQTFLELYQPAGFNGAHYVGVRPLKNVSFWLMMPICLSYRNGTDLFRIVSTSWFVPWAPWAPLWPHGATFEPPNEPKPKPKIVIFCPTIKCHTIFPLKISQKVQCAYACTYTGSPGPHMGPQRAHMLPQRPIWGPNLKLSVLVPQ